MSFNNSNIIFNLVSTFISHNIGILEYTSLSSNTLSITLPSNVLCTKCISINESTDDKYQGKVWHASGIC